MSDWDRLVEATTVAAQRAQEITGSEASASSDARSGPPNLLLQIVDELQNLRSMLETLKSDMDELKIDVDEIRSSVCTDDDHND